MFWGGGERIALTEGNVTPTKGPGECQESSRNIRGVRQKRNKNIDALLPLFLPSELCL